MLGHDLPVLQFPAAIKLGVKFVREEQLGLDVLLDDGLQLDLGWNGVEGCVSLPHNPGVV